MACTISRERLAFLNYEGAKEYHYTAELDSIILSLIVRCETSHIHDVLMFVNDILLQHLDHIDLSLAFKVSNIASNFS